MFLKALPADVGINGDPVEQRLISEYGAVFTARGGASPPARIIFRDDAEVDAFQSGLAKSTENLGGTEITLQTPAMGALLRAVMATGEIDLSITPRGNEAAARSYSETVTLWVSRVEPALDHWAGQGSLERAEADRILSLAPFDQVWEVLKLEESGLWFSKDLSKTILHSVAPPGASQHLSLLALDVAEFDDPRVREILARHGWFQTIASDLPHFTFLGLKEEELPLAGLRREESNGRIFWVPDL